MKKLFTIYLIPVVLATITTSCNKKLKDDLKDLETSVEEQKSKTQSLQGQANVLNNLLQADPISFNFSTNNGSAPVTISGNYSFAYGSANTHTYATDNGNGNYYVNIWRGNDLGTDYSVSISFTYQPSTGNISSASANLRGYLSDGTVYRVRFGLNGDVTQNISVNAFDFNNGTIEFTYSETTNTNYSDNLYLNQAMNFSASYKGKLAKNQGNE
ncbi:MAG: hypothetical protein MUF42_07965 [Cytophagaceae bacterium]|jgi:hypothetical protein|nr:hypothetical protein [Cytophagaceae bacterium]